jgi:cytochrome b involved in lipid metabolism
MCKESSFLELSDSICLMHLPGTPPSPASLIGEAGTIGEAIDVHFHSVPIFVVKCVPTYVHADTELCNTIAVSDLVRHNLKVCLGSLYPIHILDEDKYHVPKLDHIAVEIRPQFAPGEEDGEESDNDVNALSTFSSTATELSNLLVSQTAASVLSLGEKILLTDKHGVRLICFVTGLTSSSSYLDDDSICRGRVSLSSSSFLCSACASCKSLVINPQYLPEKASLPSHMLLHVSTKDGEWFPTAKRTLAPCLALTKFVQAGKGIYKDTVSDELKLRSADAPSDDGALHCYVDIDCCVFDRVLLFLDSLVLKEKNKNNENEEEKKAFEEKDDIFILELHEVNALLNAAESLKLLQLIDLCNTMLGKFEDRVRKTPIRLAEVIERNNKNEELLILVDGMVLDVTHWLGEHPGGDKIIPKQGLNMDATVFFEMYHNSRASFLYLKQFYLGELADEDFDNLVTSPEANGVTPSKPFLRNLEQYCRSWRIDKSKSDAGATVHKSL